MAHHATRFFSVTTPSTLTVSLPATQRVVTESSNTAHPITSEKPVYASKPPKRTLKGMK